jgi:DNA-binding transcriptional ArsR family regulator
MANTPASPHAVIRALGNPVRWAILRELARGEALPVSELARRQGISDVALSKHAIALRQAGLVERGWGKLYRIAAAVQVPGQPLSLDVGIATIRLDWMDAPRA